MRILGSIVEPTPRLLACFVSDHFHRCPVGTKAVCHNFEWITVSLHRFLQNPQRSFAIPLLCDECLKDFSFVINGSPEVVRFAVYPNEHLIEMPPPLR